MKKNIGIAFIVWLFSIPFFYAQSTTAIPDSNFEKYLENHDIDGQIEGQNPDKILTWKSMGDGIDNNNLVFTDRIASVESLDIKNLNITNLTGLDDFKKLETLNFSNNRLTGSITIRNSTLKNLICSSNELTGLDISTSLNLTTLNCSNNQLKTLSVGSNALLETLTCSGNQLTTIDISKNLKLVSLGVSNNQLNDLKVDVNTDLKYLSCASNQLNSIDIIKNLFLESLDISNNLITNSGFIGLNISRYVPKTDTQPEIPGITSLNISANKFDSIDFTNLTKLISFNCDSNRFTKLDLSALKDLNILSCAANQLRTLNIKNGFNNKLILLNALYNPKLYCIQADDAFVPNGSAKGWQKDILAFYSSIACENLTYVPDDNFETYLETNSMGDTILNNHFVLTASIESVSSINVSGKAITNLSGIEDFIALENLNCSNNSLINLDVSKNIALKKLDCPNNTLTSLKLTNNTALTTLDCSNNKLTDLKIGDNRALTTLNCANNSLVSLDVSKNTAITSIDCNNNKLTYLNSDSALSLTTLNCSKNLLTSLKISPNSLLTTLNCATNLLTSLDISKNTAITSIDCSINSLTSLNLGINSVLTTLDCSSNSLIAIDVTKNTQLTSINCSNNLLVSLNLVNNTTLTKLNCANNTLTSLDLISNNFLTMLNCANNSLFKLNLKNGSNSILTSFDATTNPNLSCIDVDNVVYSNTNWEKIDSKSSFSTNCNTTYIPDVNFETYLEEHDLDGETEGQNPAKTSIWVSMGDGISNNNLVSTDKIAPVTALDISGLTIKDLTGISGFSALLNLNCSNNLISSIDLSSNTALTNLNCSTNALTTLDISKNNAITAFDSTINPNLSCIKISSSANKTAWLKDAAASYNEYCNATYVPDDKFEIYLEANNMGDGIINNNLVATDKISSIISLDVSNLEISDLSGIDDFSSLINLNCASNSLIQLDLSANTALTSLNCSKNKINSLNISGNSALIIIDCSSNLLTGLDFSGSIKLTSITCNNNALTSLNIRNGANDNLTDFDLTSNPILFCVEVDDTFAPDGALIGWQKDASTAYSKVNCMNRQTNVPDKAFEQALIDLGYDSGPLDNLVNTSTIEGITNLDISHKNIFNLSGIEDCKSLIELNCSNNYLSSLNIQSNKALTSLNCGGNNLATVEVTQNINLIDLLCDSNHLTSLDISQNTLLERLNCNSNNITSLDANTNVKIQKLVCGSNKLTLLNGINNKANLIDLDCSDNYLSSLLISGNIALENLNCSSNLLTGLSTNDNTRLKVLSCDVNQIDELNLNTNTALNKLNGTSNKLKGLILTNNVSLATLNVSRNEIETISLANNTELRSLDISNNKLSDLSLQSNNLLEYINSSVNALTSLDLTGSHLNLKTLFCNENKMSMIDFSNNTAIEDLNISSNQFLVLDLLSLKALQKLDCKSNLLTELDLNTNIALTNVNVSQNNLFSLKIRNSNNNNLIEFNTSANPNLRCIEVDNAYATVGSEKWQKDPTASYTIDCRYNITDISDTKFESYLETHDKMGNLVALGNTQSMGDGIANNKIVFTNRIMNVITLDISSSLDITNLKGIEDFTYLQNLNCSNNLLSSLVLEKNTYLRTLNCSNNNLSSLVLENNTNLTTLICTENSSLISFDLSKNVLLTTLNCSNNALTSLNIVSNTSLTSLNCSKNHITNLNTGSNRALATLICNDNSLLNLNLTNNTSIGVLNISSNQFSSIDLSKLTKLEDVKGRFNKITGLNLTANTSLNSVNFESNDLITFNIKNGANTKITTFNVSNNPNLTCVEVDNPTNVVGWIKDVSSTFLVECHYGEFYVPDDAFEQALIYLGYDSGSLNNYVPNGSVNTTTKLNLNNKGIINLLGIEQFKNLVTLDIGNNSLKDLDLSKNLFLENLKCSGNQLASIDISANTKLKVLNISYNNLVKIDVRANPNLKELYSAHNLLTSLEVNSALSILDCSYNQLTNLSVRNATNLTSFNCSSNQLNYLDLKNGNNTLIATLNIQNNSDLSCVLVDDITIARANLNWLKGPSASYKLECVDNDDDGVSNENDQCPNTPFGEPVDLFGCTYFALPTSNFTVLLEGETCTSSNNGIINIKAEKTYNYTATVTGSNYKNSFKFTKDIDIFNMRSGAYELCITIDEKPDYSICYDVNITEPKDLNVTSKVSYSDKKVTLDLSGGTNYTIDFNGLLYTTTDTQINLSLSNGDNTIKIKTDQDCQGKYSESIYLSDDIFVYPNPFDDFIKVYTSGSKSEKVEINIYSTLGQLVLSKVLNIKENLTPLDTSNIPGGIYYASVQTANSSSIFKILKK